MRIRWKKPWVVLVVGVVAGVVAMLILGAAYNWAIGDGIYISWANEDAIRVQNYNWSGLRIFNVGRDYVRFGDDENITFKVTSNGAAYSDGGWQGWADFAELMVVEGSRAMYEPGDVLAVSMLTDRAVVRVADPYSTAVVGVYSSRPGFVGTSHLLEGQRDDEIPVAILGIVPCKVSAENGPVRRGDLLTSAATPGHAMKATDSSAGAILGKALGELDDGTGIIDILLTLQ